MNLKAFSLMINKTQIEEKYGYEHPKDFYDLPIHYIDSMWNLRYTYYGKPPDEGYFVDYDRRVTVAQIVETWKEGLANTLPSCKIPLWKDDRFNEEFIFWIVGKWIEKHPRLLDPKYKNLGSLQDNFKTNLLESEIYNDATNKTRSIYSWITQKYLKNNG